MVVTAVRTEQRITQMGGGTRISPAMERKEFSYVKEKYKEERRYPQIKSENPYFVLKPVSPSI